MERRLTAILSADVVGYSRLMGVDEEGTFARIRARRKELFEPVIARRQGRIFKLMGDGLLAEFASAVAAVECAVELQTAMLEANVGLSEDKRFDVRIGVNLGDVIIEDDDRHGDSINLASRLQQVAPPGGVCISGKVMAEVTGKIAVPFQSAGEHSLKNIAKPVHLYFWSPDSSKKLPVSLKAGQAGSKPSLALLPLRPLGADRQTRMLAAGVNEAVTSSLANLTGIVLLNAAEEAYYHAIGSVQCDGTRYRVTVKLLDRRADKQFWSERFDGNTATIFDTLDELALRICSALRYEIHERETERARVQPVQEQTNEQLMGQAGHILLNSKRSDYERSIELIDIVIARDPENFMALAIRAWGSMAEVVCGYREVPDADAKLALELSRKAIELNKRSDFANLVHGLVRLYVNRDLDGALYQATRSLELNPTYAFSIDLMGLVKTLSGDGQAGAALCRRALDANPRFPANNWFMDNLALACFVVEDYAGAVDWASHSEQIHSNVPRPLLLQITSHANAGEVGKANAEASRLLSACPDFRIGEVRRWPLLKQQHWDRFLAGLLAAGLPS